MKKVLDFLFSMQLAGVLLLVLAFSMAAATFIENDFGTLAAQQLVYRATWFELLMFVFSVNLLGAIFQKRLLQRKKYGAFLFHAAIVVILVGAGITRFIGYEGTMFIREGNKSNLIYSENPYIQIRFEEEGKEHFLYEKKVFSAFSNNDFSKTFDYNEESLKLEVLEFIPNPARTVTEVEDGDPIISMVVSAGKGRSNQLLEKGEQINAGPVDLYFSPGEPDTSVVSFFVDNGRLMFYSPVPVSRMSMTGQITDSLKAGEAHPFLPMHLYRLGELSLVLQKFYPDAVVQMVSGGAAQTTGQNALLVNLSRDGKTATDYIIGGKGMIGEESKISLDGTEFYLSYGSREIKLPFALELVDFQLERYPGSESPSSYASEVILIDTDKGIREPHRIFMNNVLNYGGYRFFQSSYDPDEKGTILSVNHDYWGTLITYIGYALLTLGMIISFFSKNSRFRFLIKSTGELKRAGKATAVIVLLLLTSGFSGNHLQAQVPELQNEISREHAEKFGRLLVQGNDGRIEPVNTLASELLRKISRKRELNGRNANQVLLGMLTDPMQWQSVKMIKVGNENVSDILGIDGKMAAFNDFIDFENQGTYKLQTHVEEAYQKKPAERSKFDNEIIKVDERVNISFLIYNGALLRIFPVPDSPDNKWVSARDVDEYFEDEPALFVSGILQIYADSVNYGKQTGNWSPADKTLGYLKTFQSRFGSEVFPSQTKIDMEIFYNKADIFKRLYQLYGLIGLVMLILLFISILNPGKKFNGVLKVFMGILVIGFLLHTLGLAMRWYISGHAPWSNGYESMIYIAWATMLAGLIFAKRSMITIAATAILASVILMVAHLSWMDPQITTLVPVLKSYWLIIHVAIITASYSFLGLGALMAAFNLIIMIFKTSKNYLNLNLKIREVTYIIEMSLIIGVIMLSIGTYLGGVWANESWGRYWGWDPKETWALITILIYSFILHMRLIPGLKDAWGFNFAALIGFSSVIMTYFGVNYYLSGLHSYAQGDPVPVPNFVYYTIAIIVAISALAYFRNRKHDEPKYY